MGTRLLKNAPTRDASPPLVLAFLQALNANTNGGDASRVGKRCSFYLVEFVSPFSTPQNEAAEKAPTRDASPPLVLAFGA